MQTDRCVGVGLVLEQHGDTVPERVAQRLVVRRLEPARSAQVALANVVEHILEGRVGLDAVDEDCRRVASHLTPNQPIE